MKNINKYFDGIDIIYWINLDRSVDRRDKMIDMLKHIPVKNERIIATDGKNISHEKLLSNFNRSNNEATIDEYSALLYSCTLSHLTAINIFSNTNYKYALILEDDATLEYVDYWDKKISDIMKEAPNDWELLLLNYMGSPLKDDYLLVDKNITCAQAYIINIDAAKRFM